MSVLDALERAIALTVGTADDMERWSQDVEEARADTALLRELGAALAQIVDNAERGIKLRSPIEATLENPYWNGRLVRLLSDCWPPAGEAQQKEER